MRTIQFFWDHQAYPVISDVHEMSIVRRNFYNCLKKQIVFHVVVKSIYENVTYIEKIVETFKQFHFSIKEVSVYISSSNNSSVLINSPTEQT